jgi:hypothetical protein
MAGKDGSSKRSRPRSSVRYVVAFAGHQTRHRSAELVVHDVGASAWTLDGDGPNGLAANRVHRTPAADRR